MKIYVLFVLLLCGCSTQIQHGLNERDANEIVSALSVRGFEVKKVAEKGRTPTFAVELPDAQSLEALQVLTQLKLPRPTRLKTQTLAASTGLIDTPAAERLRHLEAQEGDLEDALELLDGVASAAVELVVPAPPRPGAAPVPSKASVLLRAHPDSIERLTQQRAELRALVAASVEGLTADSVVLVIDAVVTPPAPPRVEPQSALRPIAAALGLLLSVLALVLVGLTLKLRAAKPKAEVKTTPAPQRPVVNPAVRKVA